MKVSEMIAEQLNGTLNQRYWGDIIYNVKVYGAKGDGVTDDTAAIQATIDALPARGGIVYLPVGKYNISSLLNIGNGTTTTQSTRHGISFIGQGSATGGDSSSLWYSDGTRIVWTGAIGGTMMKVNGPIHNVEISNIMLDCADIADTGLKVVHAERCKFDNINVVRWKNIAYIATVEAPAAISGVAHGTADNEWNRIFATAPTVNTANGMLLDGSITIGLDVCRNVFKNLAIIYGGGVGSYGLKLAFCDNNTFIEGIFLPSSLGTGGTGILFEQVAGDTSFPLENVFINVVPTQGVSGTSGTYGNYFQMYPTSDGSPIPSLANVYANTYDGKYYDGGNQVRRVRQISEVSSQASSTNNTTTYATVTGMSITLTTKASKLKISFTGRAGKSTAGSGFFQLKVDSTQYGDTQREAFATGAYNNTISIVKTVDVAAGSHTVSIEFKSSDTNIVEILNRILIVEELY